MKIISGEQIAAEIIAKTKDLINNKKLTPKLAIIFVGSNPASEVYVQKKISLAEKVGIEVDLHKLDKVSFEQARDLLLQLGADPSVAGIIPQLPMPGAFSVNDLFPFISENKDVDGLNPLTLGKIWQGEASLLGATPKAIMDVLDYVAIDQGASLLDWLPGKRVVIVNSSNLIGKPLAGALLNKQATVIMCNSQTQDLRELTTSADIIITATGQKNLITAGMIKDGAVIIDSGFVKDGKRIYGDVDRDSVSQKCAYLSPVPGGIGPIGVANLMWNTALAATKRNLI